MSEASKQAEALLQAARADYSPSPREVEELTRALSVELGLPLEGSESAASESTARAAWNASRSTGLVGLTKLALLGVLISAGIGGWLAWNDPFAAPHPAQPLPSLQATSHSTRPDAERMDEGRGRSASLSVTAVEEAVSSQPEPASSANRRPALAVRKGSTRLAGNKRQISAAASEITASPNAPSAAPAQSNVSSLSSAHDDQTDELAGEVALLGLARRRLETHEAERSLDALGAYQARFPKGTLRAEALLLRTLSLCELGRPEEAHRAARQLKESAPASPYLRRLDASCIKGL